MENVINLTNLRGRWQVLSKKPMTICDIGHNREAFQYLTPAIRAASTAYIHFVFGLVADKDIEKILEMLPNEAIYYFCRPNLDRGLNETLLAQKAKVFGLQGETYKSVKLAIKAAKSAASDQDLIFIGGSTFVVAEIEDL